MRAPENPSKESREEVQAIAPEAPTPEAARTTPSMAQFIEIKANNPDCLLFYRMGDFYELFFEDAEIASRTLGIVLTKRGKHAGADIPMCGVPVVRADDYLQRLIAAGHRVAICEQLEDPAEARKRGSKAVVKRDVVRIVTPGTITEDGLLDARRANILLAVSRQKVTEGGWLYGVAAVDISTGATALSAVPEPDLGGEIARHEPSEVLVPDALREDSALTGIFEAAPFSVTRLAREGFDPLSAERRILAHFGLASLEAFGSFSRAELSAFAAVIVYLERTQLEARPNLLPPRMAGDAGETMRIDAATRANLELTRTLGGARTGSLLATIDRTVTSAGGRLLAAWLAAPLMDRDAIARRHEAVGWLIEEADTRLALRDALSRAPDMPRALSRIALDRAGPRDLLAIGQGLVEAEIVAARVLKGFGMPDALRAAQDRLIAAPAALGTRILMALREEVPLVKREGGFIRAGFDAVLDKLHALRDDSRSVIAGYQARYVEESGIRTLKVKHNSVLGYFVEVPQQAGETLIRPPHNATFIHRQTMAGTMRFSTAELGEMEQKIARASDEALRRELGHYDAFVAEILGEKDRIIAAAEALAGLDCLTGLADLAERGGWTRPLISADCAFHIEGGRHPVVEAALRRQGEDFVANDCELSPVPGAGAAHILLVTGANMAGKSTYLRQNALIAILAQMGAFVPAKRAEIGLVDRLFSRVGAADDLARGRSTFMVEMVETAAILNQAGPRALVILDEIGRGTATYDGLSIAWAAMEHLHDVNRCRALFATHFHELTALKANLSRLKPVTMRVATHKGEVIFLHEVVPGAADRSYGIQVAKLAGLPPKVVQRATKLLTELEKVDRSAPLTGGLGDLPLFRQAPEPEPPKPDVLRAMLAGINPDETSPKEALELVYALHRLWKSEES